MAELLAESTLESTTVGIYRTATVVKGGRRFSFAALVVVGDRNGNVGIGYGKAPGVPAAIEKAQKDARKAMFRVHLRGGTVPHPITGRFGSSKVLLIPAAPGTGVIAGGTVRAVLEMAGVRDCLTKAHGSTNKKNLCKAVMQGLTQLRTRDEVARLRGVEIEKTEVDEKIEAGQKYMAETKAAEEAAGGQKPQAAQKPAKPEADRKTRKQQDEAPAGTTEAQASAAPSAPEHVDTDQPAPEAVDTPKEQVSGDADVEQPQPEAQAPEPQGESRAQAEGESEQAK